MRDVVEEVDGGWRIPLEGFVAFSTEGLDNTHLRLLLDGEEAFVVAPVAMVPMLEALAAAKAVVTEATVSRDTTLTVEFREGRVLAIPPVPRYENWEVQGPGSILVVGTPAGGEPAIWDATSKTYTLRQGARLPQELAELIDQFGIPMPSNDADFKVRETKGEDE